MIDPRETWRSRPVQKLGPIRHIRIPRPWWQRFADDARAVAREYFAPVAWLKRRVRSIFSKRNP